MKWQPAFDTFARHTHTRRIEKRNCYMHIIYYLPATVWPVGRCDGKTLYEIWCIILNDSLCLCNIPLLLVAHAHGVPQQPRLRKKRTTGSKREREGGREWKNYQNAWEYIFFHSSCMLRMRIFNNTNEHERLCIRFNKAAIPLILCIYTFNWNGNLCILRLQ